MKSENKVGIIKDKNKVDIKTILVFKYIIMAIIVGIVVGIIDTIFGRGLIEISDFRNKNYKFLLPFLPIAGLFITWMYHKFNELSLKGMTLVFETRQQKRNSIPLALVPLVMVGTWITHLFGGSAGREGVAVQIGATLSHAFGKKLKMPDNSKVMLITGMAAGFVTGVLHTFFGIPGILASILTQIGLYSVNLGIMGKSNQAVNVMQYKLVASLRYVTGEGNWIFFLKLILAALILIALCYWFFGTELGASIRATGCNEQMARAQGINTGFNKVLALMISNGLVGLCGGIYAQYQGAADVNMGRGAIVIGLAAVIISEVIFGKFCAHRKAAFAFTLGAVFIGAILYYLVIALVLWLKMPSDYMKLFSAVVVACFLAVPYMKDTYFKKGRAK